MVDTTEHKIFSSFKEWFDHTLLKDGQAFSNYNTPLYSYPSGDGRLGVQIYASPYYQWVYDESISGSAVPVGSSGIYADYENGRFIGGTPSGYTGYLEYSVKDFSIYTTSKSDGELLLESKYNTRPKPRLNTPTTGAVPYQIMAPCIFLRDDRFSIEEASFGGQICEKLDYAAIIISDDARKRYGVGTIFGKKKNVIFPYFDSSPFNYYGGLKSGSYNYPERVAQYNDPGRYVQIVNVEYTPIENDAVTQVNPNLFIGNFISSVILQ